MNTLTLPEPTVCDDLEALWALNPAHHCMVSWRHRGRLRRRWGPLQPCTRAADWLCTVVAQLHPGHRHDYPRQLYVCAPCMEGICRFGLTVTGCDCRVAVLEREWLR